MLPTATISLSFEDGSMVFSGHSLDFAWNFPWNIDRMRLPRWQCLGKEPSHDIKTKKTARYERAFGRQSLSTEKGIPMSASSNIKKALWKLKLTDELRLWLRVRGSCLDSKNTVGKGKEHRPRRANWTRTWEKWQSVKYALTCVLKWIYTDRRRGQVWTIQIKLISSQLVDILGCGIFITAFLKAQKTM